MGTDTIKSGTSVLVFIAERTYATNTVKYTNLGGVYNSGAFANTSYGSYLLVHECEMTGPIADDVKSSAGLGRRTEKHIGGLKRFEGTLKKRRESYNWYGAALGFDDGTNMHIPTYHTPTFKFLVYEGVNASYGGSVDADYDQRPDATDEYAIMHEIDYVKFTEYGADMTPGEPIEENISFKYEIRRSFRGTGGL